jgi:hypothetical protein
MPFNHVPMATPHAAQYQEQHPTWPPSGVYMDRNRL